MIAISKEDIEKLNYTEFISFVDQWNVPPGSISTINEWAVFGHVNKDSRVLEVACTTGFSGRELARLTGCAVHGIDICGDSVHKAKENAKYYAPEFNLTYEHMDIYDMPRDKKFTHIIIGAAIQFFSDRKRVIDIFADLLEDGGIILASPYYLTNEPLPQNYIEDAQRVIGIMPTNFDYYVAMDFYKEFEILYQSRKDVVPETKEQMEKYTLDTIKRSCMFSNITDQEVIDIMKQRLYEVKEVCNRLHTYHSYSVLVLRYTEKVFPNRFVELF